MIASAQTIRDLGSELITPFYERTVAFGMTFGLGPSGYDIRVAEELVLTPHQFSLASIVESLHMPNYFLGVIHDKSTWARLGLAVQNTIMEPGWRGHLTVELTNHGYNIIKLKPGMPIAQIIFHWLDKATDIPYAGKYQDQKPGAQPAIFEDGDTNDTDSKSK